MARSSQLERLLELDPIERRAVLRGLGEGKLREMRTCWELWAHPGQTAPAGNWHTWLNMAGRGFGKTRAGAEWVRQIAERDAAACIALVGASIGEARQVMVEGPAGLIAVAPDDMRPRFEPSKRRLTWPGGATATLYSAGEPESLRGPQHSHASKVKRTIRRRRPRTAKAGWWAVHRPAPGRGIRQRSPASRRGTGYSLRRATESGSWIVRQARRFITAAAGSGQPHRPPLLAEPLSMRRQGQRLPNWSPRW
jgi:hypothetical protein